MTIAHLSDLHIGSSPAHDAAATSLRDTIRRQGIDRVIVTGDLTEHGRTGEMDTFDGLFAEPRAAGRLIVLPGNHDCLGDHVDKRMMSGPRADLVRSEGLSVIRINTTSWHNRFFMTAHGNINRWILDEVDRLLTSIPPSDLIIVALHHHLLPLPEEIFFEHLATWLRLPFASELSLGKTLLERLRGRCDLVLHGHRHVPSETLLPSPGRDLRIYNAGSSTMLKRFRVFTHSGGILCGAPEWMQAS